MYDVFTTRSWSSTTVLLFALLLQNCQSYSVSMIDIDEGEKPATSPSSASAMRQRASGGHLAMRSSTPLSVALAAHGSPSSLSRTSAHEGARSTARSARSSGSVAPSTPGTMSNPLVAPCHLPAAAMPRVSHAVPLGKKTGHPPSPDGLRVCMSKVEGVLSEMLSDAGGDSKLPAQQRYSNLTPEDDLANKELRVGERTEPDKTKEAAKDVRLLVVKTLGEGEGGPCVEQKGQRGDPLTILLDVASSHPDKATQFLDVLLVAAQDKDCRQQALEALGKVAQASPGMFSECLPTLRAATKAEDKEVRLLSLKTLGEVEWKQYFGEVEPAPDLPVDMAVILDSTCPFWPEKQVKDTHLLVLMPSTVDGKPFTLNLLKELIERPKSGGHKTQYDQYYDRGALREQIGNNSPDHSYWLLMTRDVLPESRDKAYEAQEELVAAHARRTSMPYELPKALEAATTILTHHVRDGEWLYSNNPWTYTRCQEWIFHGSNEYPAIVGGFESLGLYVGSDDDYAHISYGVAGFRKF